MMKTLIDRQSRSEIVARLGEVRPDTARRWGRMTAPQMICHVSDAFLGIMGDKAMELPRGFSIWPLMKTFVLYAPIKWPPGVPTRPEFDQCAGGGTRPADFEADVRNLVRTIEKFSAEPRSFEFRPHPLFKAMSERDWMRWGYLHCDHHLRQFGR
jgi:Protein of unknown function (DUF1569)